jgi:hypothetical protein
LLSGFWSAVSSFWNGPRSSFSPISGARAGLRESVFPRRGDWCGLLVLAGLFTRVVPVILDISVAIASTKIPLFLKNGFWPMEAEARTDYSMFMSWPRAQERVRSTLGFSQERTKERK